jgi:hypothetical protein
MKTYPERGRDLVNIGRDSRRARDRAQRRRRQASLERLEDRVVLSYSTTSYVVDPTTNIGAVTISDSPGSDTDLVVFAQNGLLAHTGDGNTGSGAGQFASEFDWNSAVAGVQPLAANTGSSLVVDMGDGTDSLTVGTNDDPSSTVLAMINEQGAGADSLIINDSTGTAASGTYSYNGLMYSGPGGNVITSSVINSNGVTIRGGTGNNTFNLPVSPAGGPVNIVGGSGTNVVNLGNASNLANILAPVTVTDPTGSATLNLDDSADTTNSTATITSTSSILVPQVGTLTGLSPAAINFGVGVTQVNLLGGPGAANAGVTYNIIGTPHNNTTTTITGGPNANTYVLGSATSSRGLDAVGGPVVIVGGSSNADSVFLEDQSNDHNDDYTLDATTVIRPFFAGLTYSNVKNLTLDGENLLPTSGNNTFNVNSTASGTVTRVNANNGDDIVNVSGANVAILPGGGPALILDGGIGANTLNYDAAGKLVIVSPGALPTELLIKRSGSGDTDAIRFQNVVINNEPIAPVPGPPITINATKGGSLVNVAVATFTSPVASAVASDFTSTINWGDGTSSAGVVVEDASNPSLFYVYGTHTYFQQPASQPSVTIAEAVGSISQTINGVIVTQTFSPVTTNFTANVTNAALAVNVNLVTGVEGTSTPVVTLANFTDPGLAPNTPNPTSRYTVTVDWGDGSGPVTLPVSAIVQNGDTNSFAIKGSHLYAEAGVYTVTVSVTNSDPVTVVATNAAVIADAPLSVPGPFLIVLAHEGKAFSGEVVPFIDANPNAPTSDFFATIDWGDGSPSSVGTMTQPNGPGTNFLVSGTHTYANTAGQGTAGTFPVTVHIVDKDGASLTVNTLASVTATPISVNGGLTYQSDSGASHFDGITNVTTPTYAGTTKPNSQVFLLVQPLGSPNWQFVGSGVADATGAWSVTSQFLPDGRYNVIAAAFDTADHLSTLSFLSPNATQGPLTIDTVGPRINNVAFNRLNGEVDTTLQDNLSGLDMSTVTDPTNYTLTRLKGSPPGTFVITGFQVTPQGPSPTSPIVAALTINRNSYIKGGFFLLTVHSGGITDVAGNPLDGEFYGSFPSGNNRPGGDFVATITEVHNFVSGWQTVVGTTTPNTPPPTPPPPPPMMATAKPVTAQSVTTTPANSVAIHDQALAQVNVPKRTLPFII